MDAIEQVEAILSASDYGLELQITQRGWEASICFLGDDEYYWRETAFGATQLIAVKRALIAAYNSHDLDIFDHLPLFMRPL